MPGCNKKHKTYFENQWVGHGYLEMGFVTGKVYSASGRQPVG